MALKNHNHAKEMALETSGREAILTSAQEVIIKPISWAWNQWLPLSKLTILGGAGGTGKTTLALSLASTITNGGQFPDGSRFLGGGNVLIWSSEDDPNDVLVPRLVAMGAKLGRIHFISAIKIDGIKIPFDPASDIHTLSKAIEKIGVVSLLIIDPIVSAVNGDMNQANTVRQSLQPIVDFAFEHQCAVIGISHVGKGTKGKDLTERVIGSQAFTAFARMVWITASNKETGERVLVRSKSNCSETDGGYTYGIEQMDLDNGISASFVRWARSVSGDPTSIMQEFESLNDNWNEKTDRKAAKKFLMQELSQDGKPSQELIENAKENGFSEKTLRRAFKDICGVAQKLAMNGGWVWRLPEEALPPEDAH